MREIAIIIVIVGVVILIFSYFLTFKKIEFDENENRNRNEENESIKQNGENEMDSEKKRFCENDENSDSEDFRMLLKGSRTLFRGFGFFIILIGVILYIYSLFYF